MMIFESIRQYDHFSSAALVVHCLRKTDLLIATLSLRYHGGGEVQPTLYRPGDCPPTTER